MPLSKRCARCQLPKPWDQFYPRTRWADGSTRTVCSYCIPCERIRRYEWAKRNPERHREHCRRYNANRSAETAAVKRERDRTRRREVYAIPTERFRTSRYMTDEQPSIEIMAAPFGSWVAHVLTRDDTTVRDLAERWGVSERTLYAVRKGERAMVDLATVEAALCADGTCLVSDLYDDQELAA